jgi:hypothetical protein
MGTARASDDQVSLSSEFPGWSVLRSDGGRWWALRTGHRVSEVIAADPQTLREKLRKIADAERASGREVRWDPSFADTS